MRKCTWKHFGSHKKQCVCERRCYQSWGRGKQNNQWTNGLQPHFPFSFCTCSFLASLTSALDMCPSMSQIGLFSMLWTFFYPSPFLKLTYSLLQSFRFLCLQLFVLVINMYWVSWRRKPGVIERTWVSIFALSHTGHDSRQVPCLLWALVS